MSMFVDPVRPVNSEYCSSDQCEGGMGEAIEPELAADTSGGVCWPIYRSFCDRRWQLDNPSNFSYVSINRNF